jgi:hypothetical protein
MMHVIERINYTEETRSLASQAAHSAAWGWVHYAGLNADDHFEVKDNGQGVFLVLVSDEVKRRLASIGER